MPRKSSLVSRNWPDEHFLSLTKAHSWICIKIYIFNFKKQTNKQAKETKEGKTISLENRLKKWICGNPGKVFLVTLISRNNSIFIIIIIFFGPSIMMCFLMCFHSHYIEYENFIQNILTLLLSLVNDFTYATKAQWFGEIFKKRKLLINTCTWFPYWLFRNLHSFYLRTFQNTIL